MKLLNSVGRVQVLYKWVRSVWRLPSFCVSLHMTNWWKKCSHCLGACRLVTNNMRNGRICRNVCVIMLHDIAWKFRHWLASEKFIPQLLVVEEKENGHLYKLFETSWQGGECREIDRYGWWDYGLWVQFQSEQQSSQWKPKCCSE